MKIICPYCGYDEDISEEYYGMEGICEKCGNDFLIFPRTYPSKILVWSLFVVYLCLLPFVMGFFLENAWVVMVYGVGALFFLSLVVISILGEDSWRKRCQVKKENQGCVQSKLCPRRGETNQSEDLQKKGSVEFPELDPVSLAKVMCRGGLFVACVGLCFIWEWLLAFGVFTSIAGALAPKFGATSSIGHMARYVKICAVIAVLLAGGCYAIHLNEMRNDRLEVAAQKALVSRRIQEVAMKYFGHELCEWHAEDEDRLNADIKGVNPFEGIKGSENVEKRVGVHEGNGGLFIMWAELHQHPKLREEVFMDEIAGANMIAAGKMDEFKNLQLITDISRILGVQPHFFAPQPLPGQIVSLSAKFDSPERTRDGKPLVSITVTYSLFRDRLFALYVGQGYVGDSSNDRESWKFKIQQN